MTVFWFLVAWKKRRRRRTKRIMIGIFSTKLKREFAIISALRKVDCPFSPGDYWYTQGKMEIIDQLVNFHWHCWKEGLISVSLPCLISGWKRNHESWIILTKYVRILNLCFKNLGIMNLCTSPRESWIMRLREKVNKIHVYKLVAFDPGNTGYGVSESLIFQNLPGEACSRTPLYNSWNRAW